MRCEFTINFFKMLHRPSKMIGKYKVQPLFLVINSTYLKSLTRRCYLILSIYVHGTFFKLSFWLDSGFPTFLRFLCVNILFIFVPERPLHSKTRTPRWQPEALKATIYSSTFSFWWVFNSCDGIFLYRIVQSFFSQDKQLISVIF